VHLKCPSLTDSTQPAAAALPLPRPLESSEPLMTLEKAHVRVYVMCVVCLCGVCVCVLRRSFAERYMCVCM